MNRLKQIAVILGGVLFLSSCAESAHQVSRDGGQALVPPELENQIDHSVNFPDLIAAPAQYAGRVVMFSGVVLAAKRTATRTEIEILEIPAQAGTPQTTERLRSQGRFLAVQDAFLDPAVVAAGTPLTVIGEVKGQMTKPLDESEYTYPVLEIKHLIDWGSVTAAETKGGASAYYSPYYYSPYPYWWGPYGPYPYYWGLHPPIIIQRPPPPPTPPQHIPPQFKKRK